MVHSPTLPCQLVFIMKLNAVLNDESGVTAAKPCGLSGNQTCRRCKAYTANAPNKLNQSAPIAYCVQRISCLLSTPHRRYKKFSTGCIQRTNTGRLPSYTRSM